MMRLTNRSTTDGSAGYSERRRHIDLVRSGSPSFLVLCQAVRVEARPLRSAPLDARDVFASGALVELDGDVWIERKGRVKAGAPPPRG
jgi:hypothetical protein